MTHTPYTAWILSLGLIAFCALGCGDEGDDADDKGTAPTIENLTYSPDTIAVGAQTRVSGSFNFSDPDGDVYQFAATLILPDGNTQDIAPAVIQGTKDVTTGALPWALDLVLPVAGDYTFEVYLIDVEDNASNRLGGSIKAE